MFLIPVHMLQRAELRQLGHNLDATVRHDRRQHLAAANRSLAALGEIAHWFKGDDDHDDFDDDPGAAGALALA